MNSNLSVTKQSNKQTNKQKYICSDWVSKLSWKIEFFVLYNGHQNRLDKSLEKLVCKLVCQRGLEMVGNYILWFVIIVVLMELGGAKMWGRF